MTKHESQTNDEMRGQLKRKRFFFVSIGWVAAAICLCAAMAAAASHVDSTPQEVFDGMRGSFQPAKAKGVHARYQWDLSGPNGGEWWIEVNDGTYKMGKGKIVRSECHFHSQATKIGSPFAMTNSAARGLILPGRLKVRGDQGVARKLGEIFP